MQIFVIIWFILLLWIIGKGIAQYIENENSPVLTGPASIVDMKRKTHHHHSNGHHHHHTSTSYYVTFEVESGDRMELHMTGSEYGLLVEGDRGNLSFQGTRYLGFERT